MNRVAEDILMHYGVARRSGRYRYGSGEDPYQHSGDFLSRVEERKTPNFTFVDKEGKTWTGEVAVAKSFGLSTTEFRAQVAMAKNERRATEVAAVKNLREKGYSLDKIAEMRGYKNDSSIRSLLNEDSERRMNQAQKTADILKAQVDEKGMIDVGVGVERELGISREKMKEALYIMEMNGYPVYGGGVPQATNPGKQTNLQVLCPPGTQHKEIFDYSNINTIRNYTSRDGGLTFDKLEYPSSLSSDRVKIRYSEEGGKDKDGVIEIRRGVPDLSLGNSHYAQVRILVDGDKYLKGMALYSDDMPAGVDVIFNTNKKAGTPKGDVLKHIKKDPDNPFGALIKANGQSYYDDPNGKYIDPLTGKKQSLSVINKTREEGDWNDWTDHLPSQFLSKQNKVLIDKQLNLAIADKKAEYDEICSLTNPTVKKQLLKSFSDDCDSTAVHLQAAALPGQKYKVILPVSTMKDNEVYAPSFKDGQEVILVRYPHGGTFEIPRLKVNNKQKDAKNILGNTPIDAIGINKNVADRLSGADFDGDTVMIIPVTSKVKFTTTNQLEGLKNFDPKDEYPYHEGMTLMKRTLPNGKEVDNTQIEMGKISNLITDMTLKGATEPELTRAVKHSMVVIDAGKHKLDYKQSEIDNDITSLKKKYQGSVDENGKYHEGASTLISRASSETQVLKRKGSPKIDPETGKISYKEVYEEYTDKNGKVKVRTQKSTKMAETDDAYSLISDAATPAEIAYANYANKLKSMANDARKEMISTGNIKYHASAKATYSKEVVQLNDQLKVALMNAPRERKAQLMANSEVDAKKKDNPDMTKGEIKKAKQQALTKARAMVGAKRTQIVITDRQWEAIQAGAVSENTLSMILQNTDIDKLRERATPRAKTSMSQAKIEHIKTLEASGYTTEQIADKLGVSSSTVSKYLKG